MRDRNGWPSQVKVTVDFCGLPTLSRSVYFTNNDSDFQRAEEPVNQYMIDGPRPTQYDTLLTPRFTLRFFTLRFTPAFPRTFQRALHPRLTARRGWTRLKGS